MAAVRALVGWTLLVLVLALGGCQSALCADPVRAWLSSAVPEP